MRVAGGELQQLVMRRELTGVVQLIEAGVAVNERAPDGWTALARAVTLGDQRLLQLLVDAGAEVDRCCSFSESAAGRLFDPSRRFLRSQPELNPLRNDGWTPLLEAVRLGHRPVVEWLLRRGADVNRACVLGGTPLLEAARLGNAGIARVLLENGAWVDARDRRGRTALQLACLRGFEAVVKLLVEWFADLNVRDAAGMDALMCAARFDGDLLRILLRNGADAAAVNARGDSALLRAIQSANLVGVEALLQYGADALMTTAAGHGIRRAADRGSSPAIRRILCRRSEGGE
jgi:ankyrin repeat protein